MMPPMYVVPITHGQPEHASCRGPSAIVPQANVFIVGFILPISLWGFTDCFTVIWGIVYVGAPMPMVNSATAIKGWRSRGFRRAR